MEFPQLPKTDSHTQHLEVVRAARAKSRAKARAVETEQTIAGFKHDFQNNANNWLAVFLDY